MRKTQSFLIFFLIDFLFNMAANFAHPVTPSLEQHPERKLPLSCDI